MRIRRQQRTSLIAIAIGLFATAAVVVLAHLGWLDRIENATLDFRFRTSWINSISLSDALVSIDIDDSALDLVGRWPWPRDKQAGLLEIIGECQPRALLIDLNWDEREAVRPVPFELNPCVDTPLWYRPLDPDTILARAVANVGQVYAAFTNYLSVKDQLERSDRFHHAVDRLRADDTAGAARLLAPLESTFRKAALPGAMLRARATTLLIDRPMMDADALAAALSADTGDVEQILPATRGAALRRIVRARLEGAPQAPSTEPDELVELLTAELIRSAAIAAREAQVRSEVSAAVWEVLSLRAMTRPSLLDSETAAVLAPSVVGVAPIVFPIARAARACGFVNFRAEADGTMRRERLFERHQGQVWTQLAFQVGCDVLGITPERIQVTDDRLVMMPTEGAPRVIQLDAQQRMMVPWMSPTTFQPHERRAVPAGKLWQIWDRRRQQHENSELIADQLLCIAQLVEPFAELRALIEPAGAVLALRRGVQQAEETGQRAIANQRDQQLATFTQQLLDAEDNVRERYAALQDDPETSKAEWRSGLEAALAVMNAARDANARLQSEIDENLAFVRERIADRICLIGYTATALADATPTPTHGRLPGVRAHLNVLNAMLTGRFIYWTGPAFNHALAIVLGVLATLVSAALRPRLAAMLTALLIVVFVSLFGYVAFRYASTWVAITPAVLAMAVSYFSIAVYSFIFLDREQRELAKVFSQYTSAALAREMAEKPELCRQAQSREVTVMFTDLAGFTSLSERIGAEQTQRVLNLSLGCFSDVMIRHEGLINKFIGDGIFVFWNPVIHPQEDHARRACQTALELFDALGQLVDDRARAGESIFGELELRVGVATGAAVVGPCGSEQKYDYTCIGDTVNFAARLESANKAFGTRVLVGETTVQQAGDAFAVRPLGRVLVKGKRQGMPVFELLGTSTSVSDARKAYADRFGAMIAAFQAREWDAARTLLADCEASNPDDRAIHLYRDALDRLAHERPDATWHGAVELEEK